MTPPSTTGLARAAAPRRAGRGVVAGVLASVVASVPVAGCGVDPRGTAGTTPSGIAWDVAGGGSDVVLIHAFSVDRRMWAEQRRVLERDFRVVAYDLRGHGRSGPPDAPYAAYEDLRDVMDAARVDRAVLVGLSAGAQIAVDFALAYPDRAAGLVLASPGLSGYVVTDPMPWFGPVAEAVRAGDLEEAGRRWAMTPIMAVSGDSATARRVTELAVDNARIWSYPGNPEIPLAPPAIGRLSEVKVPTLVVAGEDDLPHMREVADLLARCVAGARLVTIAAAGHLVNLEAPREFNAALLGFLRGDEVGRPAGACAS